MSTSAVSMATDLPVATRASAVPWTIWAGVAAVTSSVIGGAWDVSWHRSIGRDSFLTPAHIAIYACGVVAAVVCAYLIFSTTFGSSQTMKGESVSVWGFKAPLGAFIAAWGGFAMLTSAPFDNWWHAAYGLDVKIVSPPHTLLILGIRCVSIGVQFLILAAMNRIRVSGDASHGSPATAARYKTLQNLFLYLGGLMMVGQMFFIMEYTWDIYLHGAGAYIAMAIAVPVVFAGLARSSGSRWACTIAAGIYMLFSAAEVWILPLFAASPKLGPVYYPVTHFVPGKFPILLIVPAIVLDLMWQRMRARSWKPWQIAAVTGIVFVAVLFAVEWPFASFLMSKASENRFFGSIYFDYSARPLGFERLRHFFEPMQGFALYRGLALASIYGSIGTWIGLKLGDWSRGIQR